MRTTPLSPDAIRFNAQTGTFDGLIALHTPSGTYRYPCAVQGGLDTTLSQAADMLAAQARRRHAQRTGLRAFLAHRPRRLPHSVSGSQEPPLPRVA